MSVFKNGYGTIFIPSTKWVTNVAHPPPPKHLVRAPKLDKYVPSYEPKYALPPREWVSAQITAATTVATRREWFRVMSWNVMTDSITARTPPAPRSGRNLEEKQAIERGELIIPEEPPISAQPVANVKTPLPMDLVSWDHRVCKIVDEILHHDPDIIMLNEVNRANFNDSLWKMLRSQGYGALFVSNKLDRAFTNPMDNPGVRDAPNPHMKPKKTRFEEDTGNAIFYHKGRFFPYHMPGLETPNTIPYMHCTGLRDRVTNLCVMCVACQFTAGDGPDAVAAREWEARGMLRVVDTINRNGTDRGFTGTIIAGDFNNADFDEPCVTMFQERFGSAYDVVGGARWTTWYQTEPGNEWGDQRHMHPDWYRRNMNPDTFEGRGVADRVKEYMKDRAAKRRLTEGQVPTIKPGELEAGSSGDAAAAAEGSSGTEAADASAAAAAASTPASDSSSGSASSSSGSGGPAAAVEEAPRQPTVEELVEAAAKEAAESLEMADLIEESTKKLAESVAAAPPASSLLAGEAQPGDAIIGDDQPIIKPGKIRRHEERVKEMHAVAKAHGLETIRKLDEIEKNKAIELRKKGIVKRVSDFIFFDESMLTTLRVLDTPPDSAVDPSQLLPNEEVPSHHVPLVVDM
eukprot:CAMPEP_0174841242 /NCGR_PEP_ID=MMETSP1114-20130205/9182_1 /TAXON_ID=312471 /ORGANISM="Neobodo designis, Strain CCAP 1951/1" /LENGTH=630 /DNA_ID=CAMNT_0016075423 /DNA_START=51 /DNA_END=1940 /DNA_ORIENTATION=+